MIRKLLLQNSLIICIFLPLGLHANFTLNDQAQANKVIAKGVDGIGNIASSIISDSFTPMTHYSTGMWTLSAVPAWYKVKTAYDDPEVKGEDFSGIAFGIGGGYAFSDRFMVYGIGSYMNMSGTLKGKFYGNTFDIVSAETTYNLINLFIGMGYDILGGKSSWSIPLYAGPSLQWYNLDMDLPTFTPVAGTSTHINIEGTHFLWGFSTALAVSREFYGTVRVTPYLLYYFTFNKPEVSSTAQVTTPGPVTVKQEADVKGERISAGMWGLALTYLSNDALSFSISTGGIITSSTGYYNEEYLNGLNMVSVVVSVTYNGKRGKEIL